jgi:hypothetical protein
MHLSTKAAFGLAMSEAQTFINNRLNGSPRQYIVFPAIKGKGCISILGMDKCKEMSQATGVLAASYSVKTDSHPYLSQGIELTKAEGGNWKVPMLGSTSTGSVTSGVLKETVITINKRTGN